MRSELRPLISIMAIVSSLVSLFPPSPLHSSHEAAAESLLNSKIGPLSSGLRDLWTSSQSPAAAHRPHQLCLVTWLSPNLPCGYSAPATLAPAHKHHWPFVSALPSAWNVLPSGTCMVYSIPLSRLCLHVTILAMPTLTTRFNTLIPLLAPLVPLTLFFSHNIYHHLGYYVIHSFIMASICLPPLEGKLHVCLLRWPQCPEQWCMVSPWSTVADWLSGFHPAGKHNWLCTGSRDLASQPLSAPLHLVPAGPHLDPSRKPRH